VLCVRITTKLHFHIVTAQSWRAGKMKSAQVGARLNLYFSQVDANVLVVGRLGDSWSRASQLLFLADSRAIAQQLALIHRARFCDSALRAALIKKLI
jgi:predicted oxidoreductase (fatty acid repression mutant protein)